MDTRLRMRMFAFVVLALFGGLMARLWYFQSSAGAMKKSGLYGKVQANTRPRFVATASFDLKTHKVVQILGVGLSTGHLAEGGWYPELLFMKIRNDGSHEVFPKLWHITKSDNALSIPADQLDIRRGEILKLLSQGRKTRDGQSLPSFAVTST